MQQETGPDRVRSEFVRQFGIEAGEMPRMFQAPARMNIIGEHTDYNGGLVLPATLDRHTWIAARPRTDRKLNAWDCGEAQLHRLDYAKLDPVSGGRPVEYLKGVAWALLEEGLALQGCDVAVGGDIPLGGGLSSSASLELALALALLNCSGLSIDRPRLALLCQRAESEFVGAQCGIMDQYTIALGQAGSAMMLDCRSLEYERVGIPAGMGFLVVHSGVSHRVSAGPYASRRDECREAVRRLAASAAGIESLRDLQSDVLQANRALLGDTLFRRCRHVMTENRRVLRARKALLNKQPRELGGLLNESHLSLRDDYEVSCPELDVLVDIAGRCEGVRGSRMMGAGFGGCTISLVEADAAKAAAARIAHEYGCVTGTSPWMHLATPAEAAGPFGGSDPCK